MSKLDEAEKRLQTAVLGLEEAARVVVTTARSSAETSEPDPQVAAALELAQARNAALEEVNAAATEGLEGAIGRIKTILEDQNARG